MPTFLVCGMDALSRDGQGVDTMEKHSLQLLGQALGTGRKDFFDIMLCFSLEHKGGLSSQDLRSTRSLTRAFSLSNAIAGDEPGGRQLISCELHSFLILQIEAYYSSGPIVQPFLSGAWSWSITEMR